MDNRDLKRLSAKAREQTNHIEGAFQQLAHDVAVRQKVNDAHMNEIKDQLDSISNIARDCKDVFQRYDQMIETNTKDIEILKDQMGILKNCIVDLQKRNQFLEDLNASLINQLKKLVEGLSNSALEEQNVMKELISDILVQICNKPIGSRGKRSGRTSPCDTAGKKTRKISNECQTKLTTETDNVLNSNSSSAGSSKEDAKEDVSKKNSAELLTQENKEDDPSCKPLVYQVTEKVGETVSKSLRINIAPQKEENIQSLQKSTFSSSFSNLVNLPLKNLKHKSGSLDYSRSSSLQTLEDDNENKDNEWLETENILNDIIKGKDISKAINDEGTNKTFESKDTVANLKGSNPENSLQTSDSHFNNCDSQQTKTVTEADIDGKTEDVENEEDIKDKKSPRDQTEPVNIETKCDQKKNKKRSNRKQKNSKNITKSTEENNKPKPAETQITTESNLLKGVGSAAVETNPGTSKVKDTPKLKSDDKSVNRNEEKKGTSSIISANKGLKNKIKMNFEPEKYIKKEHQHSENRMENKILEKTKTNSSKNSLQNSNTTSNTEIKNNSEERVPGQKLNVSKNKKNEAKKEQISNSIPIEKNLKEKGKIKEKQNLNESLSTTTTKPRSTSDSQVQRNVKNDDNKIVNSTTELSVSAKEFEPKREYGKAKLQLPSDSKSIRETLSPCPKLVNVRMSEGVDGQRKDKSTEKEAQGDCIQCGKECNQRCANCKQVFYCKRECQKQHWKAGHKNNCKPFKIEKNFTLGRYLTATRDFKAGDVIFKEEPLVIGPKQVTEPVCLGCYKRVNGSYRCRKCTWPLCGPSCENSPDHQPECVVGKEIGSPVDIQDFNETNHFYEVVATLRCLTLKKRSPKKYSELLNLESHLNDRKGTEVHNTNQKRVVNMLRNYFMVVDFPPEEMDVSEVSIHQMTGIIDVNLVDIPLAESEIVGIYPTYSMMEHSCTPNIKYKITSSRQIIVKAAVDIREGEHLSTIYTHMLWGTAARREHLMANRYFKCTCRRCSDPTELGTNFSALRCKKCPTGFLMSAAPLDESTIWVCHSCNETISSEEAKQITLALGEETERVLANPSIKQLENFIEKSSSTLVHPNHFHLYAAKHSLLQMLGRDSTELDAELMNKKEKLCQEFLKTCTALDPGMSKLATFAGVALYEYHLAVLARARRGPTEEQVDKVALKKDLDTAKALLQQCIKVLQDESPDKPETQLMYIAQDNLIELNQWACPLVQ